MQTKVCCVRASDNYSSENGRSPDVFDATMRSYIPKATVTSTGLWLLPLAVVIVVGAFGSMAVTNVGRLYDEKERRLKGLQATRLATVQQVEEQYRTARSNLATTASSSQRDWHIKRMTKDFNRFLLIINWPSLAQESQGLTDLGLSSTVHRFASPRIISPCAGSLRDALPSVASSCQD